MNKKPKTIEELKVEIESWRNSYFELLELRTELAKRLDSLLEINLNLSIVIKQLTGVSHETKTHN